MQPDDFAPGTVWLVGAGPGDPELLTMKAVRLIENADIVFHDALVGADILSLIPSKTETVNVGKRSGRHSKDQRTIDAMLVEAAAAGKRVVRLKGGEGRAVVKRIDGHEQRRLARRPFRPVQRILKGSGDL
jgi:uroporphyrin-III C-methyltransferase